MAKPVTRAGSRKVVYRYKSAHNRGPKKPCSREVTRSTMAPKIDAFCPGCYRIDKFVYDTTLKLQRKP